MPREQVIIDLDAEVASLLHLCAAERHVSEGELVARALRAYEPRLTPAAVRVVGDFEDDEVMELGHS
jgi:phage baseplate assembly protein W